MFYSTEQKTFMIQVSFTTVVRTTVRIPCKTVCFFQEFQPQFPQVVFDLKQFQECLDRTVQLFRCAGSITRKKGRGRSTKRTPEFVDAIEKIMENKPKISFRNFKNGFTLLCLHRTTFIPTLLSGVTKQSLVNGR
jgi:hypothetical protein